MLSEYSKTEPSSRYPKEDKNRIGEPSFIFNNLLVSLFESFDSISFMDFLI
jgi:hypothetical protein